MDNMSGFNRIGILLMGAGIGLIGGTGLQLPLVTAFVVGGLCLLIGVCLKNGK